MSDERVAISLPGIALCIAFDYAASVYDVFRILSEMFICGATYRNPRLPRKFD